MTISRRAAAGLTVLVGAMPVTTAAALAQTASHQPASIQSGTYRVEPSHTQVEFTLLHMGFSYYSGMFSNVSGTLQLDPDKPTAARLDVTIPIGSVATTSTKLDGELKSPAWFDAAAYPTATFVSTSVTLKGKAGAEIVGTLTLHGVSRPETLVAHFVGAGVNPLDKTYTTGFEATGTIRRSDFGIKSYVPLIGDDVRLTIAGAFELQG